MARLHQIKTYDMENPWKGASVSLYKPGKRKEVLDRVKHSVVC